MTHINVYAKHMTKERRIYILVAIATLLAFSMVVLGWSEGYPALAVLYGIVSAVWDIFALRLARKLHALQETEEEQHTANETPPRRRSKGFCLVMLLVGIIALPVVLFYRVPSIISLFFLWLIIVNGSEFVFVRVLTDEPVFGK